jgi:hypothetical protein
MEDAEGRFLVDAIGVLTVAPHASLDYERAASHSIRIRVTDGHGHTYDELLSIEVLDEVESLP